MDDADASDVVDLLLELCVVYGFLSGLKIGESRLALLPAICIHEADRSVPSNFMRLLRQ